MQQLATGRFYGQTNRLFQLNELTLTDTEYTHDKVDWHYHENAYFTFILAGRVLEGSKSQLHHCEAGTLLFHHCQEPHYNLKPPGFTRGFHIEITPAWFAALDLNPLAVQGSVQVKDPAVVNSIYKIFRETQLNDETSSLAIQALLAAGMQRLAPGAGRSARAVPSWVGAVRNLLHDTPNVSWTLPELAQVAGVHPAHLSRGFPLYFGCTLGDYVRHLKVQRALALFFDPHLSLLDIALACGFYDQSHFIRCFKAVMPEPPARCRKRFLQSDECLLSL